MGSTFGWRTKREVVKYIREESEPYQELDFALVKTDGRDSVLYRLLEDSETKKRLITVDLIFASSRGSGAGYKGMTESMGPGVASCPARIIDKAGPPPNDYAKDWRKRCLANASNV